MYNTYLNSQEKIAKKAIPYEETVHAFLENPYSYSQKYFSRSNSFRGKILNACLWAWTNLSYFEASHKTIARWALAKCRRTGLRHLVWLEERGFFKVIRTYWEPNEYKPNKAITNPKFLMKLDGLFSGLNQWIAKTVTLLNSYSNNLLNLFVYTEVNEVYCNAPTPVEGHCPANGPP